MCLDASIGSRGVIYNQQELTTETTLRVFQEDVKFLLSQPVLKKRRIEHQVHKVEFHNVIVPVT